jgi:hypothetical protein
MAEHANEILTLMGLIFGLLIAVLAWIGNRVHTRLDALTETVDKKFEQIHTVLSSIERDLRGDLVDLDRRIAKLETRCNFEHGVR